MANPTPERTRLPAGLPINWVGRKADATVALAHAAGRLGTMELGDRLEIIRALSRVTETLAAVCSVLLQLAEEVQDDG